MAGSREVDRLRELALKRQRAVGQKISRMKSRTGVEVAHTAFDPRRDPKLVRKYNSRQLEAYITQLDSFTSRDTQFVPDASNSPIPSNLFKQYKQLERSFNLAADQSFDSAKDLFIEPQGVTVGTFMKWMYTPRKPGSDYNPPVNPPKLKEHDRQSTDFVSADAVKSMIKAMQRKASSAYETEKMRQHRKNFEALVKDLNAPQLGTQVRRLSNNQFRILWNYTNFVQTLSNFYENMQAMMEQNTQTDTETVVETQRKDAEAFIKWAEHLPR